MAAKPPVFGEELKAALQGLKGLQQGLQAIGKIPPQPKNQNVLDSYKAWTLDLIREDLQFKSFPYAVLMQQLQGDFNMGTVVRNANAFGAQKVYYYGHKKWDRRSSVGTHNYTMVEYLSSLEELEALKKQYVFVALEQNASSLSLQQFTWPTTPFLLVVGEEGPGISYEIAGLCDLFVEIPMFGSVRSLNVGTASGIAMQDFVTKYQATLGK